MIEQDRVLLNRLAKFNQELGTVILNLFAHQNGGELPGPELLHLGQTLMVLGQDMTCRGAQLLRRPPQTAKPGLGVLDGNETP